ncbi:MAG: rhomboid family intramembrane serine protease [Pseudomonadales bacterium]
MVRALEVEHDAELAGFVAALHAARVPVRTFEERGKVVLAVPGVELVPVVRSLHQRWYNGDRGWSGAAHTSPAGAGMGGVLVQIRRFPAVTFLLAIAAAIYPFLLSLPQGEVGTVAAWLLVVDVAAGTDVSLARLAGDAQVWRWFTPMFVHFSLMHLVFNCAVVFEFGRRIEGARGGGTLWLLVAITGLIGNLAQVAMGTSPLYGGLSGVAYGLVGYVLARQRRDAGNPWWRMHPAIPLSMLIFLVLFSTGVTGLFGMHVANAAHWGGFVSGVLLGLLAGGASRLDRSAGAS